MHQKTEIHWISVMELESFDLTVETTKSGDQSKTEKAGSTEIRGKTKTKTKTNRSKYRLPDNCITVETKLRKVGRRIFTLFM